MFGRSDVVNYRSGGWGDGKLWTFLEQRLFCTGEWLAGEDTDPFSLSLSWSISLKAVVFEATSLVSFLLGWL